MIEALDDAVGSVMHTPVNKACWKTVLSFYQRQWRRQLYPATDAHRCVAANAPFRRRHFGSVLCAVSRLLKAEQHTKRPYHRSIYSAPLPHWSASSLHLTEPSMAWISCLTCRATAANRTKHSSGAAVLVLSARATGNSISMKRTHHLSFQYGCWSGRKMIVQGWAGPNSKELKPLKGMETKNDRTPLAQRFADVRIDVNGKWFRFGGDHLSLTQRKPVCSTRVGQVFMRALLVTLAVRCITQRSARTTRFGTPGSSGSLPCRGPAGWAQRHGWVMHNIPDHTSRRTTPIHFLPYRRVHTVGCIGTYRRQPLKSDLCAGSGSGIRPPGIILVSPCRWVHCPRGYGSAGLPPLAAYSHSASVGNRLPAHLQ